MLEILISLFLLASAFFTLVGSIGLARLPDFYTRLHGPTKATTLGVGAMLAASVIYFSARGEWLSLNELLITVFLFITAPISAYLLAQAALHLKVRGVSQGVDEAPPPPGEQERLTK
ncbi:MAG: Na+/H+ antiporter subunit G [Gammaproteobacteria bacterium]|nr:Na+/H+ antiporter subunit G [Gammaproteobacteria bacterium]